MALAIVLDLLAKAAVVGGTVYSIFSHEINAAIAKEATEYVLKERLGITMDLDGEVNKKTLTAAINRDILGGELEFTDLFDRAAVKADLKRIALDQAATSLGFSAGGGVEGIKQALVTQIIADIQAELAADAGPMIEAAQPIAKFAEVLARPKDETASTAVDMSEAGVSNRARQAKYRANHRRVWRIKPGVEL